MIIRYLLLAAACFAILFIAQFSQAGTCSTPKLLARDLVKDNLLESALMATEKGYSLVLYVGKGRWVLVIQNHKHACIAAEGKDIWVTKRYDL